MREEFFVFPFGTQRFWYIRSTIAVGIWYPTPLLHQRKMHFTRKSKWTVAKTIEWLVFGSRVPKRQLVNVCFVLDQCDRFQFVDWSLTQLYNYNVIATIFSTVFIALANLLFLSVHCCCLMLPDVPPSLCFLSSFFFIFLHCLFYRPPLLFLIWSWRFLDINKHIITITK